jgi:hypothetical protein
MSSEMSADFQRATWLYIPEERNLFMENLITKFMKFYNHFLIKNTQNEVFLFGNITFWSNVLEGQSSGNTYQLSMRRRTVFNKVFIQINYGKLLSWDV